MPGHVNVLGDAKKMTEDSSGQSGIDRYLRTQLAGVIVHQDKYDGFRPCCTDEVGKVLLYFSKP
jgi:hypothetical protein